MIALFHLVNHAFYKGLLFLGAGAVIHAVADNQDFRKYGGLRPFLPLTYSVMLIASLSLVAFPFMTGFYSKDFILESAYGNFYFSSTVVYFIATIGAMFTTLYSVKVLYLTFLTNPNGPLINYKQAHEGDIFMSLPLIILAIFSIFFGYITKDIFIGLGSGFFTDNALFIHPVHEIMLDTEFAVPTIFKLLPLIFTVSLSILSIVLSEFLPKMLIYFKFSKLGYNIFGFFNQRFLIEFFYNKFITDLVLKLGGQTTKVIDKGSVELLGPYGLENGLIELSKAISSLSTGVITSYALFILVSLLIFILIPYSAIDDCLVLILIFALFNIHFKDYTPPKIIDISENRFKKKKQQYTSKNLISLKSGLSKFTFIILFFNTKLTFKCTLNDFTGYYNDFTGYYNYYTNHYNYFSGYYKSLIESINIPLSLNNYDLKYNTLKYYYNKQEFIPKIRSLKYNFIENEYSNFSSGYSNFSGGYSNFSGGYSNFNSIDYSFNNTHYTVCYPQLAENILIFVNNYPWIPALVVIVLYQPAINSIITIINSIASIDWIVLLKSKLIEIIKDFNKTLNKGYSDLKIFKKLYFNILKKSYSLKNNFLGKSYNNLKNLKKLCFNILKKGYNLKNNLLDKSYNNFKNLKGLYFILKKGSSLKNNFLYKGYNNLKNLEKLYFILKKGSNLKNNFLEKGYNTIKGLYNRSYNLFESILSNISNNKFNYWNFFYSHNNLNILLNPHFYNNTNIIVNTYFQYNNTLSLRDQYDRNYAQLTADINIARNEWPLYWSFYNIVRSRGVDCNIDQHGNLHFTSSDNLTSEQTRLANQLSSRTDRMVHDLHDITRNMAFNRFIGWRANLEEDRTFIPSDEVIVNEIQPILNQTNNLFHRLDFEALYNETFERLRDSYRREHLIDTIGSSSTGKKRTRDNSDYSNKRTRGI